MKDHLSADTFLTGSETLSIKIESPGDFQKNENVSITINELREDIRNYVDNTTNKAIKVFTSLNTVAGGRIEVLDESTLYYYPSSGTSSLNDYDIVLTSDADKIPEGVTDQKQFNESIYASVDYLLTEDIFLQALKASTTFNLDADGDPINVQTFSVKNQYLTTPATPEYGYAVNINDLNQLSKESVDGDILLQKNLEDTEELLQNNIDSIEINLNNEIEGLRFDLAVLLNTRINSNYFVYETNDIDNATVTKGQIFAEITPGNSGDPDDLDFIIHASGYPLTYTGPDDADGFDADGGEWVANNYNAATAGNLFVTGDNTYLVETVTVLNPDDPLEEQLFKVRGTIKTTAVDLQDGDYIPVMVSADSAFDPNTLNDKFVKRAGDEMSGKLDIKMSNLNDVGLKVLGGLRVKREDDLDGKNALTVNHNNIVFEAKTTFKRPDASNNVTNFSIEGRRPNSTNNTDLLFYVYRVNDNSGDAINYYGRIENANNIINKGHLDETINFNNYPELT